MAQTLSLKHYFENEKGGCKVKLELGTPKSLKTLCCHFSTRPIDITRERSEKNKSSAVDNYTVKTNRLTLFHYGMETFYGASSPCG